MIIEQASGSTRSAGAHMQQVRSLNERSDVAFASAVFELTPGDRWIATNQIVAQFAELLSSFEIDSLGDFYGLEWIERIDWLPRAYLLQLTPAATMDTVSLANALVEDGHAVFAHPNFMRKLAHRTASPGTHARLGRPLLAPARHRRVSAWQVTTGSPEIVVAIIDDGVDVDHHAFPNQVAPNFNAIDRSANPRPPAENVMHYLHGTACAGLAVGAASQTVGTSGVAPGCRLHRGADVGQCHPGIDSRGARRCVVGPRHAGAVALAVGGAALP